MKFRLFIYITVLIFITFGINIYTYGFEVKNKARTYSTIQIGKDGAPETYSLPPASGKYGQILTVGQDNQLVWQDYNLPPDPVLPLAEPLLRTAEECAKLSDEENGIYNKFLPVNPYYTPHRGYCIASLSNEWADILNFHPFSSFKIEESWQIDKCELPVQCRYHYANSYDLTPDLFWPHLWHAISPKVPVERYFGKFTPEEQEAIRSFIDVIQLQGQDFLGRDLNRRLYLPFLNGYMNYERLAVHTVSVNIWQVTGYDIDDTTDPPTRTAVFKEGFRNVDAPLYFRWQDFLRKEAHKLQFWYDPRIWFLCLR